MNSTHTCRMKYVVYLLFGGPPRVPTAVPVFLAPVAVLPVLALGGALDFPGLGNFTPNFLSNLEIICGFGIALPLSYSPTTCGFSLITVANSFCVIFFAVRAYFHNKNKKAKGKSNLVSFTIIVVL